MRVIHFVPYYPPERLGGVGEYAARLHRALLEAGHESLVVTRGVRDEPGVRRIARSALAWTLCSAAWAERASRFDVVHTHAGEALPLLLALALRRRRPPILATFHVSYAGVASSLRPYTLEGRRFGGGLGPWLQRTALAGLHRAADALALRIADAVVPITRACARELLGPRAERAEIIYHGVPDRSADPGPLPERVALLYVGTGGHRKRVNALPFVLARVRESQPRARLRIVGFDWSDQPELRRLFAERDLLGAVDCAGHVPSERIPAYYGAAEVLLVPSAYEGLPLVIVEAMRCGLPVVASHVSGHPEAVEEGRTGFLVPLDDPAALARRCVELLSNPELRAEMGRAAARLSLERFSMERHLRAYLDVYARLCDRR